MSINTVRGFDVVTGILHLAEIRNENADVPQVLAKHDSRVAVPLGLSGPYVVETTIVDRDSEQSLSPFAAMLTPAMTAWDVMRIVAAQWKDYRVMDDMGLAAVHLPEVRGGRLTASVFCSWVSPEQQAQLPRR